MKRRGVLVVNLKKLALVSSILLILSGCVTTGRDATTSGVDYVNPSDDVLVCKIPLQLDTIDPIIARDYEWIVLNNTVIKEMIDNNEDIRYYALTPKDFQNWSINQVDILRYLKVQREQLERTLEYYSTDVDE